MSILSRFASRTSPRNRLIQSSIKPFWPLLLTFILPRAWGYINTLKTAIRTRPPPKPLPPKATRSLNILFISTLIFFIQSITPIANKDTQNIFATTNTRLGVPTDLLFARLAKLRPNGILTTLDSSLRSILIKKEARNLYLRYGPDTLLNCPFCTVDEPLTYALYHISTQILVPHLLHLLALGLATSSTLTGPIPASLRTKATLTATMLCLLDIYLTTAFTPPRNPTQPAPVSQYLALSTARPLVLCLVDALAAFLIWASATGRLIFFPFLSDPAHATPLETLHAQSQTLLNQSGLALQAVQSKIRAFHVARNTVVRDESLKEVDDEYWRTVVAVEGFGEGVPEEVWLDEEVQGAIARVYGDGAIDVPRARREAAAFVEGATRGLERDAL